MARRKPTAKTENVVFNLIYEDGTLSSNRRVPGDILGGLDGYEPARGFFEAQDRDIAQRSGMTRGAIETIKRV